MHKKEEMNTPGAAGSQDAALFLADVEAQIQYKPAAKRAGRELYAHMEDKAEEYRQDGMGEEEAMRRAVKDMGDASALGVMLNRTYRPRFPVLFISAVILAVMIGLAGNIAEYGGGTTIGIEKLYWVGASLYFPIGLIIFGLTVWKGYPWIIRYSGPFLALAGICFIGVVLMTDIRIDGGDLFWHFRISSGYMLSMPVIVLSVPVLLVLAYKLRNRRPAAILLVMGIFGLSFLCFSKMSGRSLNLTFKIISFAAFLVPMICLAARGCFRLSAGKAVLMVVLPGILIAAVWTAENSQVLRDYGRQCFRPEDDVRSSWDDSYNSILIKELLPQARPFGGIQLSPQAWEEYYTSEWYFDGNWDSDMPMRTLMDSGKQNTELELTDILPQHYHNNYRIAFWILKYGWVPGLLLAGGILVLYLYMFRLVKQIRNPLGRTVSLSCAMMLAMQTGLYFAGNFGFQFAWFTTLPFISEGLASIAVNMILAGLIASACGYDHVVEETEELKTFRPFTESSSSVIKKREMI